MQPPRRLRVLVTDDDPIQLRIAARLLRELGHSGALANNGQIALDMLDRLPFDVMLLDLNMPVLDGLGTLAGLRGRQARGKPALPVVLISGNDLTPNWSYYRDAGATDHLTKPLDIDALAAVLLRL
jgi:CheY-like chemotaxis protein